MTRFARAKGSKSSNERAPEDGTPWAVMKEQLASAKHDAEQARLREQAEKQRLENYENFLKEQRTAKRKSTWCDFPDDNKPKQPPQHPTQSINNEQCPPKKDKKKKKTTGFTSESTDRNESEVNEPTSNEFVAPKKIIKNKKQKVHQISSQDNSRASVEQEQDQEQASNPEQDIGMSEASGRDCPDKKNKRKNKKSKDTNAGAAESAVVPVKQNKMAIDGNETGARTPLAVTKQKKKGEMDRGKPVRRKADDERSFQIIINGREVELVRYDGFPVMQRDAERLEELRRSMAEKGIPRSELQRTMKLERRRAEKALARLKREVCYNCRKGGHNLSECPELKSQVPELGGASGADGVCFKCGSTEHRQFECRVQRGQDYRFASCFICKEQGHIARQCPDNPKGLYPNGGGCRLCGDVTHLRKDCPTTQSEREDTSVRLETLAGADGVEGTERAVAAAAPAAAAAAARAPKKIKF